ncbi:MAG: aldolase/citrate lyase family protein [Spirochaetia bacterium]|nr:aldolase/citrate lyase family protein [Spirochaetia bacterium]
MKTFYTQQEKELRNDLVRLKKEDNIVAIKTGTEIEDMGKEEIRFFRRISENILPLIVKIGGPEARQDIRVCLDLRVDCVLSPMIETVYALRNFLESILEIAEEKNAALPKIAMNLESITAYSNLDAMIDSTAFKHLYQVTIGRGDFSKSVHLTVDDDELTALTANALRKLKRSGIVTSVGGGLKLETIAKTSSKLPTDRFNSRHMVLERNKSFQKNPVKYLFNALLFEKKLYEKMALIFPERKVFYYKRINVINNRLGPIQAVSSL